MRLLLIGLMLLLAGPAGAGEAVLDLAALPRMNGEGAKLYAERFLLGPLPRAWAIGSDGSYGGNYGNRTADLAKAAALTNCAAKGATDCALYAVDLDVVWKGRAAASRDVPGPLVQDAGHEITPDRRFLWHGPAAAKGLFVWAHGFNGINQDVRGLQPPPFLRAFNNAGWDIARFDREPTHDALRDRVSSWLAEALVQLRARGWRRLGVAGQSRGGWNALEMLRQPGRADVIITLSAGPGTGTIPGLQATVGQTELWRLVADTPAQPTRLAYAQFEDDPYGGDKAQRAARVADLRGRLGGLLLIDRPSGLKGHGAGESLAFGTGFGACLLRFAEGAAESC